MSKYFFLIILLWKQLTKSSTWSMSSWSICLMIASQVLSTNLSNMFYPWVASAFALPWCWWRIIFIKRILRRFWWMPSHWRRIITILCCTTTWWTMPICVVASWLYTRNGMPTRLSCRATPCWFWHTSVWLIAMPSICRQCFNSSQRQPSKSVRDSSMTWSLRLVMM